ncbi:uncharacterized protein LOC111365815 [Olea europaea var. sylvestris]|uniref:Uncharacterized protein n=1 Tax=Olea europaea subsp. europaea TaxID=158383 RepID=A0A8S0PRF5_OLEEU|nr:uncharacterized protein LOC111365815 [Olea europaea var. sylvestris]CAA2954828.1 Hypothetical predicted protein [Olea europaea subsp. europaea]
MTSSSIGTPKPIAVKMGINQSSFLVENPTFSLPKYPDCKPCIGFDDIIDTNDLFVDPIIRDLGYWNDENLVSDYIAEPSEFQRGKSSQENGNNVDRNMKKA